LLRKQQSEWHSCLFESQTAERRIECYIYELLCRGTPSGITLLHFIGIYTPAFLYLLGVHPKARVSTDPENTSEKWDIQWYTTKMLWIPLDTTTIKIQFVYSDWPTSQWLGI